MIPFAVAGVQINVSASHENVSAMKHKVDVVMARFPWVQMIVFSELATYGPLPGNNKGSVEFIEEEFSKLAAHHGVWILPGSIFEKFDGRVYNTASVINPAGEVVGRYRKMFPFAPYEAGVDGGTEFLAFDVPGIGRFGVSICYDIWFPETTRTLTAMGVEVLLHPVLTGTIDRDVELSIARATAAMFQCYVFDINGLGAGGTGRSIVIDPAGTVLYQAGGHEEIIPLEIDLEVVRRQRAVGSMGLGQHQKSFRDRAVDFDVYNSELFDKSYLESLGPLTMPQKGGPAGLEGRGPQRSSQPGPDNQPGPKLRQRQTRRPVRAAANDLKVRLIGK
jgi:predicted amidohydrolase